MEDRFIAVPDTGIPVLDDRLEEDIHLELEAVQDEELFDGFVDEGTRMTRRRGRRYGRRHRGRSKKWAEGARPRLGCTQGV